MAAKPEMSLRLRNAFGLRSEVDNHIHFLDDITVLYPVGHNITILGTDTRDQTFIPCQNHGAALEDNGMTAIDLSPNKKFLAIAERTEKGALIVVYEITGEKTRKRRTMTFPEMNGDAFVSLKFSPDSRSLLALGSAPDWVLINYMWDKGRATQVLRNQHTGGNDLYSATYCPRDPSLVVLTGNGIIRFLQIQQHEFKPVASNIGRREPQEYPCHAWDEERRLLVGGASGEVLVYEGNELKGSFDIAGGVWSLVSYSKGLLAGGPNGTVTAYEKVDDKEGFYQKLNRLHIENYKDDVINLAVSPSEDKLVCTTSTNQAFCLPLNQIDVLKDEPDDGEPNFRPMLGTNHHQDVTGMDICVRKPWMVTCGPDRFIRVWNWAEGRIVLENQYKAEPLSVAMHPTGLYILAGFPDKMRLMNVLRDEIRSFKELPVKGCREVQFAHGGQYFAVANSTVVQIYDTWTFENVGNLRGHTGKVRSISWSADDTTLITAGMDSTIMHWDLRTQQRLQEHEHKGCSYTSALVNEKGEIYAIGNDATLKVISEGLVKKQIGLTIPAAVIGATQPPARYLYAGTKAGMVQLYVLPLEKKVTMLELQAHSAAVTQLRVSYDDAMIFTASEDGSICVFELKDREITRRRKKETGEKQYAEEILVTKADVQRSNAELKNLDKKVQDLTLHNDYEVRMKEMSYQEKLREVVEKFKQELDQEQAKYNALQGEEHDLKRKYETTLRNLAEKHEEALGELEKYHAQKLEAEQGRHGDLSGKLGLARQRWTGDETQRAELHDKETQELRHDYVGQIDEEAAQCSEITKKIKSVEIKFEEVKQLLEEDGDDEIEQVKQQYDVKLRTEKQQTLELRGNNGMLKREFAALQQTIKNGNDQIMKSTDDQRKLVDHIKRLEKDIESIVREIDERDTTVKDKDRRIIELQKKNQELEKFKFVLDYKIHELDRQIKPREKQIDVIGEQISQMKTEIRQYDSDNTRLQIGDHSARGVRELELKLAALQKEDVGLRAVNARKKETIGFFRRDLHALYNQREDAKALVHGIKKLYHDYGKAELHAEGDANAQDTNVDVNKEYQRYRGYLERSVEALEGKLEKDKQRHRVEHQRVVHENTTLLKEINELRKEVRSIYQEHHRLNELKASGMPPDVSQEMEGNRRELKELRQELQTLHSSMERPRSREVLPPIAKDQ